MKSYTTVEDANISESKKCFSPRFSYKICLARKTK